VLNALVLLALAAIPIIVAITLHEAAHGYAALALGDDTARQAGRLSLNPLRHVDRFGTLILPGLLLLGQALTIGRVVFMFGWAKPVPVSAWKFRHPRQGMALVAAAGPAMNFLLAWLTALLLHGTASVPGTAGETIDQTLTLFILSNLVLGLFNLLPIPPLDGGRIMVGILPEPLAIAWARLERAGIVIVLLAVFLLPRMFAEFGIRWDPVGNGLAHVLPWATGLVYRLAGWNV
jgi:Zn-dependent protease